MINQVVIKTSANREKRVGPGIPAHTGVAGSLLLSLVLLAGCGTAPPAEEVPSAQSYYEKALEILKGRRILFVFRDTDYANAVELFQEVIDNYPYSEYAILAEIKIADIDFEQKKYEEAASYYQDFVELHPKHREVPYAIYRNGLCAFKRIGNVDQDQTSTREAMSQFQVLLERYPESNYAKDAAERLQEAIDQLASYEIEIADFYFDRGEYHAAARRLRKTLAKYPQHSARAHTLIQLGICLRKINRPEEAEEVFQEVLALRAPGGMGLDKRSEKALLQLGVDLSNAKRESGGKVCRESPDLHCEQSPALEQQGDAPSE